MLIARYSAHIEEDMKRNWSSWSFGADGFEGTKIEFDEYLKTATDETPVFLSGFELYREDVKSSEFGELYEGYWVLIDTSRGSGLSCNSLDADNVDDAVGFA